MTNGTLEGNIIPGDITFYRLQSTADSRLRAYVAEGKVLPVDPCSFGSIGVFAIPEMKRFYRHVLIEGGFPHHGAVCAECGLFPQTCGGCRKIKGKVYWLQYTGDNVCKVYDCCVNGKGHKNCGACEKLPCEKFTKDPTVSDEENAAHLESMVKRLKG